MTILRLREMKRVGLAVKMCLKTHIEQSTKTNLLKKPQRVQRAAAVILIMNSQ